MLHTSRRGFSDSVSALNTPSNYFARRRSMRSISSVYSEIEYDVSVSVYFDNVLEFRVGHHAYGFLERIGKFQSQTHVALSHQIKVIVLAQISGQIERVQSVSVSVVFATYIESLVLKLLSGAGKQTSVSSYIQSVRIYSPAVWVSAQIAAVHPDTVRSRSGYSV